MANLHSHTIALTMQIQSWTTIVPAAELLFCSETNGQEGLEAKLSNVLLSHGRFGSASVYDGDDFIYILGG
jgi:hypothetical protein